MLDRTGTRVFFSIFFGLASFLALAKEVAPLPPSTIAQSPLPGLEAAIPRMVVSHAFPGVEQFGGFVQAGVDISDVEVEQIQSFLDGTGDFAWAKSVPAKRKEIIYLRYHSADARLNAQFVRARAKKLGRSILVTDLNDSMVGTFDTGEKTSSDFTKSTPNTGALGRSLQEMLDAKYKYSDPKYGIFSHPLYANRDRLPLMHQKEVYLIVRGTDGKIERAVGIRGTANSGTHAIIGGKAVVTRYNRALFNVDPLVLEYEIAHTERMLEAFGKGLPISKIESLPPLRVEYPNGDVIEIAYTDGQYNPNDRITALFDRAAQNPTKLKIKKVLFSHFVLTNGSMMKALKLAMKAQARFKVFGIFDDRFVDLRGYGLAPGLDGYDVLLPFGKVDFGVGEGMEGRTELYAYQRGIEGSVETSLEGPPDARHVFHDKTTYVEVEEDGVPRVYIFTGSFNASNNYNNAERQEMLIVSPDSLIARAVCASVEGIVKSEPRYAIPLPLGVLRNELGKITGHSDLDITTEQATDFARALSEMRFDDAFRQMQLISRLPTHLIQVPSQEVVADRMEKFFQFVAWHAKEIPSAYEGKKQVPLRRLLSISEVLSSPDMTPFQMKLAVRSVLWDPTNPSDRELQFRRTVEAWKILGLPGEPIPDRAAVAMSEAECIEGIVSI